jgi:hypothetical protein
VADGKASMWRVARCSRVAVRSLSTGGKVSSVKPANRPSEATVKRLAQEAKLQQAMWNTFVPEQGIRFGDK